MGYDLNSILQALRVLQEAAIRGEVPRPFQGVCGNLCSLVGLYIDAYGFVMEYADDWEHAIHCSDAEGGVALKTYFVPHKVGQGRWEGDNLTLRLELIDFLIEKCEAELANKLYSQDKPT